MLIEDVVLERKLSALPFDADDSLNLGTYENTASDLAEGLRYICAAIEDTDLKNGVSTNGHIMNDVLDEEIAREPSCCHVPRRHMAGLWTTR